MRSGLQSLMMFLIIITVSVLRFTVGSTVLHVSISGVDKYRFVSLFSAFLFEISSWFIPIKISCRKGSAASLYGNHQLCIWEIENMAFSSKGDIFNLDIFGEIPLHVSPRLPTANPATKPTLNVLSSLWIHDFFSPFCTYPPFPNRSHKHSLSFLISAWNEALLFVQEDPKMTKQWLIAKVLRRGPR